MTKKIDIKKFNIRLVLYIIALCTIGVLVIGSAKQSVQSRQFAGVIVGFFIMLVISFLDYNKILKLYWPIYIGNLALLLLVQLFGDSTNNSQRWVELLGIRFQPSELAKILLILFYAQYIMKHKENLNTFGTLLKSVLLFIPPLILVYNQPDLSTTIMLVIIFCVIFYVGGLSPKVIIGILAVVIPTALIFLFIAIQPDQQLIKEYQQRRILAWLYPEKYKLTTAYQQQNSITAIGSGQLYGKGLNNNEVGSVKNGNYISEAQTDFIFAIIGEELGFVGSLAVILLEMLVAFECFLISKNARDISGTIISSGMGALVCFQSFINIGVTTGILPNTGLPLPFVSYGLTSLVSLFIGMGFVLNVGMQRTFKKDKKDYSVLEDVIGS